MFGKGATYKLKPTSLQTTYSVSDLVTLMSDSKHFSKLSVH